MTKLIKLFIASSLLLTAVTQADDYIFYEGNSFGIKYPKGFVASPAMRHDQYGNYRAPTDEAFFTSPDAKVEFFVYSPSWDGRPENYLKLKPHEKIISKDGKKSFRKNSHQNYVRTYWKTIKEKNGAYYRSYVYQIRCHDDGKSTFNDCESDVFGIKYKNKRAYDKYRADYILFKKSLEKYADA